METHHYEALHPTFSTNAFVSNVNAANVKYVIVNIFNMMDIYRFTKSLNQLELDRTLLLGAATCACVGSHVL